MKLRLFLVLIHGFNVVMSMRSLLQSTRSWRMTKKLPNDGMIVKLLDLRGGVVDKKGRKRNKKQKAELIEPEVKDLPDDSQVLTTTEAEVV
jgi:hypothetical protein